MWIIIRMIGNLNYDDSFSPFPRGLAVFNLAQRPIPSAKSLFVIRVTSKLSNVSPSYLKARISRHSLTLKRQIAGCQALQVSMQKADLLYRRFSILILRDDLDFQETHVNLVNNCCIHLFHICIHGRNTFDWNMLMSLYYQGVSCGF